MADRLAPNTSHNYNEESIDETNTSDQNTEKFIRQELDKLYQRLLVKDGYTIITCNREMVQVRVYCTECKQITILFQFPTQGYPLNPVLIELKSKTISPVLLKGLAAKCDVEANNLTGQAHVHKICYFIRTFLQENPLSACADELSYVKSYLIDPKTDTLKQRLKAGCLIISLKRGNYILEIKLSIPDSYPIEAVGVQIRNSNIPIHLCKIFNAEATEIARACVNPPLAKKSDKGVLFKPSPSLKLVAECLIDKCFRKSVSDICHICNLESLPINPIFSNESTDPLYPVRVLCCSHLYHYSCIDQYLKTPPFEGGKKCLACGQRVFHENWKDSVRLMEERWAYKEAKNREMEDVVDFFT
ncbi:hypothetical protein LOD99_3553 [Oopsacas minuta]|uniref:RING-type domain-containing protein n=1 Tax=Oopsacas minuta TaxID=111878 RepID=A0AAV7JXB1_9METZ|nr:hypothetical protein LOD99_3553 [Oopsacas minuta]